MSGQILHLLVTLSTGLDNGSPCTLIVSDTLSAVATSYPLSTRASRGVGLASQILVASLMVTIPGMAMSLPGPGPPTISLSARTVNQSSVTARTPVTAHTKHYSRTPNLSIWSSLCRYMAPSWEWTTMAYLMAKSFPKIPSSALISAMINSRSKPRVPKSTSSRTGGQVT